MNEDGNMTEALKKLKSRGKRVAESYAKMLMAGKIDWEFLGRIYDPTDERPDLKAKKIIRRQNIQLMVREEIAKELERRNINPGFVLDNLLLILESCKKDVDGDIDVFDRNNALKVTQELGSFMDLKPNTRQITQIEEMNYNEIAESVKGKTKKTAKLKQTTKKPLLND